MTGPYRPPQEIDFQGNVAQQWNTFKTEFEIFLGAADLEAKPEKRRVMILLNFIGRRGRAIYDTFQFENGADKHKLKPVLDKFEEHCIPKQNELLERQRFYERKQKTGESATQYASVLRKLAETCNFRDAEDSAIRDQLVRGMIPNEKLKDKLYESDDLTLEKALKIFSTHEIRTEMLEAPTSARVDAISTRGRGRGRGQRGRGRGRQNSRPSHNDTQGAAKGDQAQGTKKGEPCGKCGHVEHNYGKCPASNATCMNCKKKGHYARMCFFKKTYEVQEQNDEYDDYMFIDCLTYDDDCNTDENVNKIHEIENVNSDYKHVNQNPSTSSEWKVKVKVENVLVTFKLDTGSEVNTMTKQMYDQHFRKHKLKKTKAKLVGYFGSKVCPHGKVCLSVEHKGKLYPVEFMVVDTKSPILGLQACTDLGMIKRVCEVKSKSCEPKTILSDPKYNSVFKGLGCIKGAEYDAKMNPDVKPVVNPPRRVPHTMLKTLKEALESLVKQDVIEPVTEPTQWVNSLVIVEKPSGKLRLCIDPRDLNKGILREHYPMRTVEDVAAHLSGKNVFSVLDAGQAFYQIRVTEATSKLLTFNSPFGRYKFKRMPFGISSASEVWERTITDIFSGIEGVEILRDDILIAGSDVNQHNSILKKVLDRALEHGLGLNKDKCKIAVDSVKYQGHIFSKSGVEIDRDKVKAITNFPAPENVDDVTRWLGMVTYVGKFIPNLSKKATPLRLLQNAEIHWHWGSSQQEAFDQLKSDISNAPVLKYYSPSDPITVSVDASSYGLGACMFQNNKPVAYASRALTVSEKNYGQIEKEMLAISWGCGKFHDYIYGRSDVLVETDHKPLEALYKKPLGAAPPRLQRMMLKIQKYTFTVMWKKGKDLTVADALSRAPSSCEQAEKDDDFVVHSVKNLPISDVRLEEFKKVSNNDVAMQMLHKYTMSGWPNEKHSTPDVVKPYWTVRDEIYVSEGLVLRDTRLIVPMSMRKSMLKRIHSSHLGIEKCVNRAKDVFFWPGMVAEITEMCESCTTCAEYKSRQRKEPMIVSQIPEHPWQKAASDLFVLNGETYVLLADYYSKFVEFTKLSENSKSQSVIEFLAENFARHGIPEQLITDGGPQYDSKEFRVFEQNYGFVHIKSSPEYPQSNGFAESQVKILKGIIKKTKQSNSDLQIAILEWRNTPIEGLGSPAQLSSGRRLRSTIPTTLAQLKPKPIQVNLHDVLEQKALRNKEYYDRTALKADREQLKVGERVRMRTPNGWLPAKVTQIGPEPRSYHVQKGSRIYRRNRRDLMPDLIPMTESSNNECANLSSPNSVNTEFHSAKQFRPIAKDAEPIACTPSQKESNTNGSSRINASHEPNTSETKMHTRRGREIKIPSRYK